MPARSLVVGATGFIGSALVQGLAAAGSLVTAVSRHHAEPERDGVRWLRVDPQDVASWRLALEAVEVVYHLGWSTVPQTASADPVADVQDNVISSLRLFEAIDGSEVKRLVFASSGGTVYGRIGSPLVSEDHPTRPISAYGVSKLSVEHYLEMLGDQRGLDSVSLRIGNPYGPGQTKRANFGAVTTFARLGLAGQPITIFGDGSIVRDYLFIDDVVEAVMAAGARRGGPTVINVGSGEGRSLNEIVATVEQIIGRKLDVAYQPGRRFDVPRIVLDPSRAGDVLGWRPRTSFPEGVRRTVEALRLG